MYKYVTLFAIKIDWHIHQSIFAKFFKINPKNFAYNFLNLLHVYSKKKHLYNS